MMNKIKAKQASSFGRDVLTIFVDDKPLGEIIKAHISDSLYKDLWCAWLLEKNSEPWEQHANYIWTLTDDKHNCNLPILLCPCDMDFWCTVVVTQVRFCDDIVVWEKFGLVMDKIDNKKWRESGIQNIDKWSENDWNLYGDSLAGLSIDDKSWESWWSEHWLDEENRRIWNYFHPYFNDDENIKWLNCGSFSFPVSDYEACVSAFREYVWENLE